MSNALLACLLLNRTEIREKLIVKGIEVPETTTFIPACHNTTTDQIIWYDNAIKLFSDQERFLNTVKQDVDKASDLLRR